MFMCIATGVCGQDLALTAPLEPVRSATIYAGVRGQIAELRVNIGDRVSYLDTIAVLKDRDLELREAAALMESKRAETVLGRVQTMHTRGLASEQQIETARYDVEVKYFRWLSVHRAMEQTRCVAPSGGVVTALNVQAGDWVTAGAKIARIIATEDLQTRLFVPEDQLGNVHVGLAVVAVQTPVGDSTLKGHITHISPVIDPNTGTCMVTSVFPNVGLHIRPGALVHVRILQTVSEGVSQ